MKNKIGIVRLSLSLIFRHLTSRLRVFPSVFVIGATKSGSSSISAIVWDHPAHVAPMKKEHMYLQKLPEFRSNYEKNSLVSTLWGQYYNGHAQYTKLGFRKFFPLKLSFWYRKYIVGQAFTSECDPFNFYCPTAMYRIKAICNTPKIIIVLREPVARAYSDWNMHRFGGETKTFEQCIESELDGSEKKFRKRYLNQSYYLPHLKRWFDNFPSQQIFVIKAEEFFKHPDETAKNIYDFLELEPHEVNWSKVDFQKNSRPYENYIEDQTKNKLKDYFKEHNKEIYNFLGNKFYWP